jgi:hypothetical protein
VQWGKGLHAGVLEIAVRRVVSVRPIRLRSLELR